MSDSLSLVANVDDFEDGELISDEEDEDQDHGQDDPELETTPTYTPLLRPGMEAGQVRPRSATNSSLKVNVGDIDEVIMRTFYE